MEEKVKQCKGFIVRGMWSFQLGNETWGLDANVNESGLVRQDGTQGTSKAVSVVFFLGAVRRH